MEFPWQHQGSVKQWTASSLAKLHPDSQVKLCVCHSLLNHENCSTSNGIIRFTYISKNVLKLWMQKKLITIQKMWRKIWKKTFLTTTLIKYSTNINISNVVPATTRHPKIDMIVISCKHQYYDEIAMSRAEVAEWLRSLDRGGLNMWTDSN